MLVFVFNCSCSVRLGNHSNTIKIVGRDSSVGVANRYGKDGPGIEYRWGRDFPHASRPALGPSQWVPCPIPGVKRPGRGLNHLPHN
jgi:hypothetical protein